MVGPKISELPEAQSLAYIARAADLNPMTEPSIDELVEAVENQSSRLKRATSLLERVNARTVGPGSLVDDIEEFINEQ